MKKIITHNHKDKAVILLAVIVGLLFVISVTRKDNASAIQNSFESVYKDRLVVDDYIFRISRLVEYKRDEVNCIDNNTQIDHNLVYDSINSLMDGYATTVLTDEESKYFSELKTNLIELERTESYFKSEVVPEDRNNLKGALNEKALVILHELEILADIQFKVAEDLYEESNSRKHSSFLISKLENALIIIACILGIVLVSSNPLQRIVNSKLMELN